MHETAWRLTFGLEYKAEHSCLAFSLNHEANIIVCLRATLENARVDRERVEIDFVQGSAERLDFLTDESADLVISAEAARWFDWPKMWPELARVMRKGATAAFWERIRMHRWIRIGKDRLRMQKDWGNKRTSSADAALQRYQRLRGRSRLLTCKVDSIERFKRTWDDVVGLWYTNEMFDEHRPPTYYPDLPSPRPILIREVMSWDALPGYLRTWGALHTFKERHPDDAQHSDGPLEVRFWNALREGARSRGCGIPEEVVVEWPVAMVVARKV